nr:transglutaminase-like domain-containing protein [Lachnospiraceae bacterium]
MRNYKKILKRSLALAIAATFATNAALAEAADFTASTISEVTNILRNQGLARNTGFTIQFTGSEDDLNYIFDEDSTVFYYDLATLDDANTTNDADYIVGNIDFSVDNWMSTDDSGEVIQINYKYFETTAQTEYVNKETPQILSELNVANMSNYDKVKTIHDYVCNHITYVDDADNCSSAYSAYSTGKGLCNSYALCMYKLLVSAGVPCKWIGGTAGTGRDSGGHAWNIVALGDKWYNLDATWDDSEDGTILYDYFLKGSNDFDEADTSQVHTPDKPYTN